MIGIWNRESAGVIATAIVAMMCLSSCQLDRSATSTATEAAAQTDQTCWTWAIHGDVDLCPLHGDPMEQDEVKLVHGYLNISDDYVTARENEFPYSNMWTWGDCSPTAIEQFAARYCPRCRATEKQWSTTRPDEVIMIIQHERIDILDELEEILSVPEILAPEFWIAARQP